MGRECYERCPYGWPSYRRSDKWVMQKTFFIYQQKDNLSGLQWQKSVWLNLKTPKPSTWNEAYNLIMDRKTWSSDLTLLRKKMEYGNHLNIKTPYPIQWWPDHFVSNLLGVKPHSGNVKRHRKSVGFLQALGVYQSWNLPTPYWRIIQEGCKKKKKVVALRNYL